MSEKFLLFKDGGHWIYMDKDLYVACCTVSDIL